jgi:hypothetical protein
MGMLGFALRIGLRSHILPAQGQFSGKMALTMTSMRVNTFLQGSPMRRPATRAQAKRLPARHVLWEQCGQI